ncbi:hypothetical protein XU18_2941 [Perkinsela sp. CCAP 1560/4]|nr:hypothetical protein XU18_2941 [Perkinsela sp. CCAP 1560/4]|eukprot:KNH06185.1 hypothetical protein XU18_2941 [Perkinsela sp. CCAP 1560/4]
MLGVLHFRRAHRADEVKPAYRMDTRLQQALQDYLHDTTPSLHTTDGQDIEWDSESASADKECYVIIQSNDSSTTLGRGGPTELVRNFLKNFRKVPRASCMISLETWEENRSSPTSTHRKQTTQCHAFSLQCLRGKLHVRRKSVSPVQPKEKIELGNVERIDFSPHHSSSSGTESDTFKEIEFDRNSFPCGTEGKNMHIEIGNESELRTSLVDQFLEDISRQSTSCPNCTDASSCSQTLGSSDKTQLSTGDSFALHSSGVVVTCYALQSYDDFAFYLAAPKPLMAAAFLYYKNQYETQRFLVEQALDSCFQTLASLDGQHNTHYLFGEESADDATQNVQSSSEAISKTQLLDIVAHLETFVEKTPGSGKKVLFSESTSSQLNGSARKEARQKRSTDAIAKSASISRQEIISCLDCPPQGVPRDEDELSFGRYPLESQVVYYDHDDSCEKAGCVNFHFSFSRGNYLPLHLFYA